MTGPNYYSPVKIYYISMKSMCPYYLQLCELWKSRKCCFVTSSWLKNKKNKKRDFWHKERLKVCSVCSFILCLSLIGIKGKPQRLKSCHTDPQQTYSSSQKQLRFQQPANIWTADYHTATWPLYALRMLLIPCWLLPCICKARESKKWLQK